MIASEIKPGMIIERTDMNDQDIVLCRVDEVGMLSEGVVMIRCDAGMLTITATVNEDIKVAA